LEALEEVREVIRKERRRTSNEEKIILNKLKSGVSTVSKELTCMTSRKDLRLGSSCSIVTRYLFL
jgi:hypothetical protein